MKPYFEYSDTLKFPYEAFIFDAEHSGNFPVRSHWHYFVEILYLIEGQAYIENGFRLHKSAMDNSDQKSLVSVAEYISCHYPEDLRVERLAALAGMSYSSFAAKFHRYYGMPCSTYIHKVRLSHVEDLLLQTDYDLTCISHETGFCDCSHLIRSFHKEKGITPKQFRSRSAHAAPL